MADYIVDVSAIIPYFITEVYTPQAEVLFQQLADGKITLAVPEFGKVECVNVFWKQVRFQGLTQVKAEAMLADLNDLDLEVLLTENVYEDALRIGIQHQLAIYDSIYIALAKVLNFPLITVDQKQAQAAQQANVTVKPLTDFAP